MSTCKKAQNHPSLPCRCVSLCCRAGVVSLSWSPLQTVLKRGHFQLHPVQQLLLCSSLEDFTPLTPCQSIWTKPNRQRWQTLWCCARSFRPPARKSGAFGCGWASFDEGGPCAGFDDASAFRCDTFHLFDGSVALQKCTSIDD